MSISQNERAVNLSQPEPAQLCEVGFIECAAARAYGSGSLPHPALADSVGREVGPFDRLAQGFSPPNFGATRLRLAYDSEGAGDHAALNKPVARAVKLAVDLVLAGIALALLAPVMVLIACAVRCDGGPALFAHARIGRNGRVFRCLKFRSMVIDSDAALQRLFARDPAAHEEWVRTHKLRQDPRVTWIGRILRKTSLDELPQLLNVLKLDMSLVGPRPIVSAEVPKYGEDISFYYATRPGITGLWQVSGRSDITYAHRVRLDSWYVRNWTLSRDIVILVRTIPAVLSARGAG